ncbi:flavin reductase family protein [Maribacter litopenaei]|uniref:Flavin reductase family protein n=1 Tax=Maribacter litopenaei TaxID=2976127 RepID=A0ABY5Y528_9FLAO|nr:flavin reductase family protein [Maribacter litopenaei]UWX54131.1 flavin reductase family protein [Maribacter litopenaei]
MHFNLSDLTNLPNRYRANLINSSTGYRPSNLLGTKSPRGVTNLGIFNSITHIGSNPALVGFVLRPLTVRRDTYNNIKASRHFTINHVNSSMLSQSHKTSAKYDEDESEFEKTGLTEEYLDGFQAPYVKESQIKLGCSYVNEYPIKENGCILIIGAIEHLYVPDTALFKDGSIDLENVQSIANIGLDGYALPKILKRFAYARPNETTEEK